MSEIDRAMLQSMAASFRGALDFSFNRHDMAKLMDRCASRTDVAQAAVAAALEAAANVADEDAASARIGSAVAYRMEDETAIRVARYVIASGLRIADAIRALITKPQYDALAAHVAAEVAKARAEDAAMVDALSACKQVAETAREYSLPQMVMGANKCHDDISDLRIHAHAILALRDKPAPAVLPLLPDMVDAATAAGVVVWWDNEAQEIKMAVTVQEAARVLLGVFEDPDANAPHGFDWQSMYDEMTADHKESLDICGTHDWPSTLIVALRAIAGGGDE